MLIFYRLIRCTFFHLDVLHLVEEGLRVPASSKFGCYGLLSKLFNVHAAGMVLNLVAQVLSAAGADVANLELTEAHRRIKIKTLIPGSIAADHVARTFDLRIQVIKSSLLEV